MIPDVICHWIAKRAAGSPLAERFEQNYLQLMRCAEADYDGDIFIQNLRQRLRLLVTSKALPPSQWLRFISPQAQQEIARWTNDTGFFAKRTLIPLLRWNGLPLMLMQLMRQAPEGFDFLFLTQDPHYLRLSGAKPYGGGGLLSDRRLVIFVFIDERLKLAPLVPVEINGNRLLVTSVLPQVLTRLHLDIQTLIPASVPYSEHYQLTGNQYSPDEWQKALNENFMHLLRSPAEWGLWDDISVLLHG